MLSIAAPPPSWPVPEQLGFGGSRGEGEVGVLAEHQQGRGWSPPRLAPRAALQVGVGTAAVQHGLSAVEGLKAYRGPDGRVRLFRGRDHAQRLRASAGRLCLPDLDAAGFLAAVGAAVRANQALVPRPGEGALYLRVTLLALEQDPALVPSQRHLLVVTASGCAEPDAPARPFRLWAEEELARAVPGGLATVKSGASQAGALFGRERARRLGYDDALWLDGRWRRDVTGTGSMNLFLVSEGRVLTPALDGNVLPGVTRASCLSLLESWQVPVAARAIPLVELLELGARGRLAEVFAVGTAARLLEIEEIGHAGGVVRPRGGGLARRLRDALAGVQGGTAPDPLGWREPLPAALTAAAACAP